MTFSNPVSGAQDGAEKYVAALLDLLGERDPLNVQRELCQWIQNFVADLPADLVDAPEALGKWSIADTVQHLAHTESVYAYRYRVVFAETDPVIPGFDQDAWAARLNDDSLPDAVNHLVHTRRWNLLFLERLSMVDLTRAGRHAERGVESLDQLIRLGAAHDLVHRRQLERIRNVVT